LEIVLESHYGAENTSDGTIGGEMLLTMVSIDSTNSKC
jgi:hypothetical protein